MGHWTFPDLKTLMARASPPRSGDVLAGLAAQSAQENVAAKLQLAETPLQRFLAEPLVPYEADEVTRLILDTHDAAAFAPVAHMPSVGEFRDWLLSDAADTATPRRAGAGTGRRRWPRRSRKIMRNQDLLLAAKKAKRVTRFRDTIGLPRRARRPGCSPTTRPTSRRQSWRRSSTVCCSARATR